MFFSSNIFSRYFKQFDWTAIVDDAVSKLISLLFLFIMRYRALCARHLFFNKWRRGSLRLLVVSFIVSFYRKHPVFRMPIRQALYTRHRIGKV